MSGIYARKANTISYWFGKVKVSITISILGSSLGHQLYIG